MENMDFRNIALETLKQTSRTFYIPIARLPEKLQDATASAYLCMRAIDEIEDTPYLDNQTKAHLLRSVSLRLQEITDSSSYQNIGTDLASYKGILPEVSLSIGEWASLADKSIFLSDSLCISQRNFRCDRDRQTKVDSS